MCKVHVRLTTLMIPHCQSDENNVQVHVSLTTSMIPHYQKRQLKLKIMIPHDQVQVSLTTSMIPHYQNDENNVQGTSKFNNINDTPLPKRRK